MCASRRQGDKVDFRDRATVCSPIQQFRWAHVPSVPLDGPVTYRVSAMFRNGDQPPVAKATAETSIRADRATGGEFLNVGFTRGSKRRFPKGAPIASASLRLRRQPFDEAAGRRGQWG